MIPFPTEFVVLGFLGGSAYVLLWSKGYEELKSYANFRHAVVGAITGYVYSILYSGYNFPNFIMAFIAGYMGTDFLQGILERFKKEGG